jgi:hypothetical protein
VQLRKPAMPLGGESLRTEECHVGVFGSPRKGVNHLSCPVKINDEPKACLKTKRVCSRIGLNDISGNAPLALNKALEHVCLDLSMREYSMQPRLGP